MSESDLFVVCKNCSSEVSPYVTECPYCGQRVRKRAPRIDKEHGGEPVKRRRVRRPSLSRLRPDEIPGIAPDSPPYGTAGVIVVSLLATIASRTGQVSLYDMGALLVPLDGDWWRLVTTPFLHDNLGYQFVALIAVGIFGMLVERRYGRVAVVVVFLASGAGGAALAEAVDYLPALGANGAALGLLCAWLWGDRMAARRGEEPDSDLLGVYVIAAVLVLLSLADEDASLAAASGGALVGSALGAVLTSRRR